MDKLFKEKNINHYSIHSQYKTAIVERLNRLLRSKLAKYFVYIGKKKWYNILNDLIKTYNNTKHGGINFNKPIELYNTTNLDIWLEKEKKGRC